MSSLSYIKIECIHLTFSIEKVKSGPLIHPDTGHEIKKQFYVSVPYFSGLSEAFKKIFKYMAVQVCFKGVKPSNPY